MLKLLVFVSLVLTMSACAHKQVLGHQATGANAESGKVVMASVEWVKNKKDSIDMEVRIMNGTDTPIRVYSSDISLKYGDQAITPRQTGDLRISPGVRSQALLIFMFGRGAKPRSGPADLKIVPYDDKDQALAPIQIHFDIASPDQASRL